MRGIVREKIIKFTQNNIQKFFKNFQKKFQINIKFHQKNLEVYQYRNFRWFNK